MSDIKEYITHNYTSLNEQIDELANREKKFSQTLHLKNQQIKTRNYIEIIKYTAIGFLALGLLALLIALAIRLIVYRPAYKDIEIVRPEVVIQTNEKERIIERNISSEGKQNTTVNDDNKRMRVINENEKNNNEYQLPTPPNNNIVVENFTKFISVSTSITDGVSQVVTGRNYASEDDFYPETQFCYIHKNIYGQAGPVRIELSTMDGNGTKTSSIDQITANLSLISISKLYELEQLCSFLK